MSEGRRTHYRCSAVGDCGEPAAFLVYAAYPDGSAHDAHPKLRRYPAAMHSPCADHLAATLASDAHMPAAAPGYFVTLYRGPTS